MRDNRFVYYFLALAIVVILFVADMTGIFTKTDIEVYIEKNVSLVTPELK